MRTAKTNELTVRLCSKISSIGENPWNVCAGSNNPFTSYHFLNALEVSGCASENTGWLPCHLVVENNTKDLVGCAPMYIKYHSQGEYVFDHSWAQAFEQAGGHYYPKLLIAVPFTPVTGKRLLINPNYKYEDIRLKLVNGAIETAQKNKLSSVSINFPTFEEYQYLESMDFLRRIGEQFHWKNKKYNTFKSFLNDLSSRKRKAIIKERKKAIDSGITIVKVAGDDIYKEHWDAFYKFYLDTSLRKWGKPYLNRKFFNKIGETMSENVLLILAKRDGEWIAGALNMMGSNTLFGRYWGCLEHHNFLHFEICYYQAIEFAIENKYLSVEAGAQGPHKLSRGYLPQHTYSAHWLSNPNFRQAVEDYLTYERKIVHDNMRVFADFSPYKKSSDSN